MKAMVIGWTCCMKLPLYNLHISAHWTIWWYVSFNFPCWTTNEQTVGIEHWPVMNIWWLCPKFFYWHGTLGIATRCVEKLIKTLRSQHVTFACVWYTLPNKWKIGSPQKNIQTCGPQIPRSVASWACSEIEVQPQWTTGIGTEVTRCGTFWMQHDARKTARRRWDKKSYQKGWVHVESVLGH